MNIIVTGDADEEMVYAALNVIHAVTPISVLIETGGPRAELWARFWAEDNNVEVETIREETPYLSAIEAFKLRPRYVLAFPWFNLSLVNVAKRRGAQICYAQIRGEMDASGAQEAEGHAGEGSHLG
jgi:hypothetical protein